MLKLILSNVLFFLLLIAVSLGSIVLIMIISRENAEKAGLQLAENYRLKDNTLLIEHKMILDTAGAQIKHMKEKGKTVEEIHQWIHEYSEDMIAADNTCFSDVFAYLSGDFYPGNMWDIPESYDATTRDWYREAIALDGDFYFSDIYLDAETLLPVITISKAIGDGDAIGIDIQLGLIRELNIHERLQEDTVQVTFDRKGEVIGHRCDVESLTCDHTKEYCDLLYDTIKEKGTESSTMYKDLYGEKQVIYAAVSETGWITVAQISGEWTKDATMWILLCLCLISIVHLGLILRIVLKNLVMKRAARKSDRIINALSQTYSEIYLVNIVENTCETIKTPDEMGELTNCSYTDFLTSLKEEALQEGEEQERLECFSPANIYRLLEQGVKDHSVEYRRKVGDGYQWVHVQLLYNLEELHRNEVILAFQRIDSRKERELRQRELLELSVKEAQSASKAKSDFLSNMSHEMRTPLNAIVGFAELSKTKSTPAQLKEYMEKIGRSSRQLLRLINNLLDMVKIEQGAMEFYEDIFDIQELVEQTADVFRLQLQSSEKTMIIRTDVKHRQVKGDSLRIMQILNNLLSNAVKFTESGDSVTVELSESVAGYQEYSMYRLTVRDTGLGMSKDFLERIFIPFEQEKTEHQRKLTGTGIGMPIVKSIVQAMNGTIQVESSLGEGTTFLVSLPLYPVTETGEEEEEAVTEEKLLEGRKVLLVEDNEINMEIAKEVLALYGCQVDAAWNGKEAVELFENHEVCYYDVILMDMKMPVMDGMEATRAIRSLSRQDAKTVPIIALTANAFSDDIAHAMEAGMNGHLSKPLDFTKLMETLKRCIP